MALRRQIIPAPALGLLLRRMCTNTTSHSNTSQDSTAKLYSSHLPTSPLQKMILFAGSAAAGLADPWRSDMVAVNGEVLGLPALAYMHSRMKANPEGMLVLQER